MNTRCNVGWFKIEKIDDKTYALSEYNHWEQMHSYLLLGDQFAVLIDTGLGLGKISDEVAKLTDLPIKVVTTHAHWDHIGGHSEFSDICVHEDDAKWIEDGLPIPLEAIKSNVIKDVKNFPEEFDIDKYEVYKGRPSEILRDRQIIDMGGRTLEVLHTPGHSPGHICLYDMQNKYLFSGDLLYLGTLYAFYPSTDPVKYKKSIEKVLGYDIKKVLPAHNSLDVPEGFIDRVYKAFIMLEKDCGLKQGAGLFEFGDFSIQI